MCGGLLHAQPVADTLPALTPHLDPDDTYRLEHPRATVTRHLYYLGKGDNPAKAADALHAAGLPEADRIRYAVWLKQIFDAHGEHIKLELIPDNPNFVDSTSQDARYVVVPHRYPSLYVRKYGNQWLYAPETIAEIERIHSELIPPGLNWLMRIPGGPFFSLLAWQYVGLLVVVVLCALLYFLLSRIMGLLVRLLVPRLFPQSSMDTSLIPRFTHPASLLIVLLLLGEVLLPGLLLPIGWSRWFKLAMVVAMPVLGVLVAFKVVNILASILRSFTSRTDTTMDDQLVPLLTKVAKIVVGIFGVIFVLQNLDVNVTALLAGVSIGGLAVALAAQETVKNFIGSVSIFVDRPFVVGDFINAGDISGTVTEVGVRTSRIRALDGALVTVPNGKLADMVITNHNARTFRRYATSLSVTYGTPVKHIEAFVEGVRNIALAHPLSIKDSVVVQFHEMANSSLNIFFAVSYETADHTLWLKSRQEVFVEIMRLADDLGVSFAFPSTSVYIEEMPLKH